MREADDGAVATSPFFAGLEGPVRERLLADARIERVPAGTILFREGEKAEFIHLMMSGVAEIMKMEGPRECGVLIFTSGDIFMPAAAMWDEPYLTSARALTPARLLLLRGAKVKEEAQRSPELAMRVCRLVSGQWRMAVRHILDLKCRSAPERLAAFLLRLVDASPFSETAELPFPKRSLAARVGMTAETLSRTLQQLADNGLHLRGTRIVVKDRARIDRFCGPDPYPERAETALGVHAL